jgi:hypothetical protein
MKRVLIIHGWGANSESNWFPWLKQELEKTKITVYCPSLPNTDHPKQSEWLAEIRKLIGKFDSKTSIVGHSLGAISILRILESLEGNESVGNAILVSGFTNDLNISEISDFFKTEFNWEKIRKKANKIIIINSDDDPFVPLEEGEKLRDNLKAEFIVEHKAGHINLGSGHFRYERILGLLR